MFIANRRHSIWLEETPGTNYPSLEGDSSADVVVVGAGITGLTAAKMLRDAGKTVLVLEMRRVGGGETSRTTAHLTEYIDGGYGALFSKFGAEKASLVRSASRFAIEFMAQFAQTERDACDFSRVPGYFYTESEKDLRRIEEELPFFEKAGVDAQFTKQVPLPFPVLGAIRLEDQAQFHPMKYLLWLAKDVHAGGGRIAEGVRVTRIEDGEPCRVITTKGVVTCRDVVVAANVPISNRFAIHTKIAPYRSYAIAAKTTRSVAPGLYWDTDEPYHYTRTVRTDAGDFLIVGGEDHKVGQERDTIARYENLEFYTQAKFGLDSVECAWSGQIIEPADLLPFIGRNSGAEHIYVATGYAGTGMTFGTVAARVVSDAILEREDPWRAIFDATRIKPFAQAKRYLKENIDYPAHLVGDALAPGEVREIEAIPKGEGRLMRTSNGLLAVYKDDDGEIHACSSVCTHLGCRVGWNNAEKSWDCPCHGGRFDPFGEILNGPPTAPLDKSEWTPKQERKAS